MGEKRNPTICPNCKCEMIPMARKIELIGALNRVWQWWVCPRRKSSGEIGCGHATIVEHTDEIEVKV